MAHYQEFKDRLSVCRTRKYFFKDPCRDCIYFPCEDKSQSQSKKNKEREETNDGIKE